MCILAHVPGAAVRYGRRMRFSLSVLALCCSAAACSNEAAPSEAEAETETTATDDELRDVTCKALPESWMHTWRMQADGGRLQLRVGEARPEGAIIGDVLFFHGFADRLDNHQPMFTEWTKRGFRVISFEYPSHGETCGKSLAFYMYPGLARLAAEVELSTREDAERPLLLAGWSMGGLLATRLLQGLEPLSRPVRGAMLLTPGVAVHTFLSRVENETLTRNPSPPHTGPIAPVRPAVWPVATNLLYHARVARSTRLPKNVPVLTVVGGDEEDVYAKSADIRAWVTDKRDEGALSLGLSCPGGYHEIDNEPEPMGPQVQRSLGQFATAVLEGTTATSVETTADDACQTF